MISVEEGTEHTDKLGKCGFCKKEEGGYAKRDTKGNWRPACWPCVRPVKTSEPKIRKNRRGYLGTIAHDPIEVIENVDPSTVSNVHESRVELASDQCGSILGTDLGSNGQQRGRLSSGSSILKRKRVRLSKGSPQQSKDIPAESETPSSIHRPKRTKLHKEISN